jgi:hypothetical protein
MMDNVMVAGVGSGENLRCYKIGRKLDGNTGVANSDWDKNWSTLPYSFSWENQGGGIDIGTVQGKKKLLSLISDNHPGKNEGLYQVRDIDSDPKIVGR